MEARQFLSDRPYCAKPISSPPFLPLRCDWGCRDFRRWKCADRSLSGWILGEDERFEKPAVEIGAKELVVEHIALHYSPDL